VRDYLGRQRLRIASSGLSLRGGSRLLGDLGTNILMGARVKFHQLGDVELRGLDDLDLADEDVLERVDTVAGLLDLLANKLGDELVHKILKLGLRFAGDDIDHLGTNGADLGRLGIRSLLELVGATAGEANAKHTEGVAISSLDVNVGFDKSLPFADNRAKLVGGESHTVEVGKDVLSLDIFNAEAHLAECLILILVVEVSEGDLKDTALETIRGNLGTLSAGDEGLANLTDREEGRSLNIIPVLLGEGVDDLTLTSLLSLGETLVLAYNHDYE